MQIREPNPSELDDVYRMGFDVWGDGQSIGDYLKGCRASPKYKKGAWFVLVDQEGTLYSSLIAYSLSQNTTGIGSIATPPPLRKRGHASLLIAGVLERFEKEGFKKTFLFSDIDPSFYEKLGFSALPEHLQKHSGSVCMIRGESIEAITQDPLFSLPGYF